MRVKQGRFIDFGFEPCANAFFDFYVTPKYIDPPLLELQDVAFFLFLRKNVNPSNPNWKMPSVRQMMRRLHVSQRKLDAMIARLSRAKLLEKESGLKAGEKGENVSNDYLLSDPYPTLEEFLVAFYEDIKDTWKAYIDEIYPVREMHTGARESDTPPVRETDTAYKQTTSKEQTVEEELWHSVLETLRLQLPAATFDSFIRNSSLVSLENGTATIELANSRAKGWVENRLEKQIRMLLSIERGGDRVKELHIVEKGEVTDT